MKKKIILIGSGLALLGAGIGVYFYFKNKNKVTDTTGDSSKDNPKYKDNPTSKDLKKLEASFDIPTDQEYSSGQKIQGSKILKVGAKGRRVALLQALLNYYKGQSLKIDGAFGNETRFALLRSGFVSCISASLCEVKFSDFKTLLNKAANDSGFKQQYSTKNNKDMKAVWNKYAS